MSYPCRAPRFITHPPLKLQSIIPRVVNMIDFAKLYYISLLCYDY